MPCLTADEPLPRRPMRVLVAGTSGSGKSTLARRIGAALGLTYFEIDALYHGPDWVPRPRFLAEVTARAGGSAWVTEWQYSAAREVLADRADLLVWLDLPQRVVMGRVVRRTVVRSQSGVELWNDNREPPLRQILTDRDHIVGWAWRTHGDSSTRVRACLERRPGLTGVRLRSQAEVERWVSGPLSASAGRDAAGWRVLQVGAGPGRFTRELARLGAIVVVTNLSPVQLALKAEHVGGPRSRTAWNGVSCPTSGTPRATRTASSMGYSRSAGRSPMPSSTSMTRSRGCSDHLRGQPPFSRW